MEELKELVKIVTNKGQKKISLLDFQEEKPSKEMEFFHKIQRNEYADDIQAQADLYDSTEEGKARYKMLKSRLRKKLLNHLFFLDDLGNNLQISQKYEQECLDLLHLARMLKTQGEYALSEKLLKKAFRLAKETDYTHIVVSCLELLLFNYSQEGKHYLFYRNQEILMHYRVIAAYEREAEDYYNIALLELNKSIEAKKEYLPKLSSIIEVLEKLWKKSRSYNIFFFYYRLSVIYQELTGNFESIIDLTLKSEQLLTDRVINEKRFDQRYNKFTNVYAHLRTKNFEDGLRLAQEYIKAFDPASRNWFAFMENYFLMALHSKKYELAFQLLSEADQNPAVSKLNQLAKERWALYRSYLYFVAPFEALMTDFKLHELVAAVPEYTKDKQGFNVAILILQILYFVRKNDVESLMHRLENLRKYGITHLKDDFSDRTRAFLKLLKIMDKENFDAALCRRKGKYLHEKLQTLSPPGDAYAEIEIIPYEHLWEMILQSLETRKIRAY